MIILEDATPVDFGVLGLSSVDPPCKKAVQAGEDAFCQLVQLLGAKWWDSEARAEFVGRFAEGCGRAVWDVEVWRVAEPMLRERRWVKVGWEGGG